MMSGMRNEAGDAEAGLSAQIDDAVVICFDDRHLQIILVEENDIGLPPVCKLYAIHCERVLQAVEKGLDDSRVKFFVHITLEYIEHREGIDAVPGIRHLMEFIGHRNDPRVGMDLLALAALGEAGSVQVFAMLDDAHDDLQRQAFGNLQEAGCLSDMGFLNGDVSLDSKAADIMQQGCQCNALDVLWCPVHVLSDEVRIIGCHEGMGRNGVGYIRYVAQQMVQNLKIFGNSSMDAGGILFDF